jgi:pimeloyl-ACP methyl ester carboxylesterase
MRLSTATVGSGPRSAALVHGMSASIRRWDDVARLLADEHGYTVTLVDLRGHGDSPRADRYHLSDFADDLVETLPTGLDLLMGQSLGGRVVIDAAARLQPRQLVALDPGLKATKAFEILARYLFWIERLAPERAVRRAMLGTAWTCDPEAAMAGVRESTSKYDRRVRKGVLATALATPYVVGPPPVPAATLVVPEAKSIVVPPPLPDQLRAAGWDVRVKPGATHEMHLQDPAGLLALLSDLL